MTWKKDRCIVLVATALVVSAAGCFGESVVTAGSKVAAGQISTLSANEIKILNQTIIDVLTASDPTLTPTPLTDAQAEAVSAFFVANSLDTIEDFEALADASQTDPSSIQGLDALAAAFADSESEFDSDNIDEGDLDAIFEAVLSGL